jgi:hypothetical protein
VPAQQRHRAHPESLADLVQLVPDWAAGVVLLDLQRALGGPDVQGGGEQRLGDRVVQVAGDALSLKAARSPSRRCDSASCSSLCRWSLDRGAG